MPGLVLFDIDGTLLLSRGAGMVAIQNAGIELFGDTFTHEGIDFAGCIDVLIVRAFLERNNIDPSPDNCAKLRAEYHTHLQANLAEPGRAYALAGAHDLVAAVRNHNDLVCGLLTGNFPETGALKLHAAGFDRAWFSIAVWGDDSPHDVPSRDHLPGVAMDRLAAMIESDVDPESCVIVGDTPHDIACAHAHGCRCVAVATGQSSISELTNAGADVVVSDLTDTSRVMEHIYSCSDM